MRRILLTEEQLAELRKAIRSLGQPESKESVDGFRVKLRRVIKPFTKKYGLDPKFQVKVSYDVAYDDMVVRVALHPHPDAEQALPDVQMVVPLGGNLVE